MVKQCHAFDPGENALYYIFYQLLKAKELVNVLLLTLQ
jgi:hypothetical protein